MRVARRTWQSGQMGGLTASGEDIAILRPEEIRQLPERHALVVAENGRPILAGLDRCIDGPHGSRLLAEQATLRDRLEAHRAGEVVDPRARRIAALVEARRHGLVPDQDSP